jgi:hypothetical protein
MTDLREQLRAYYDEVVQRVDATSPGDLRSESTARPKSRWAPVVAAAVLTLVVGVSTVLLLGDGTDEGHGQIAGTGGASVPGSDGFTWTRHPLDGPITYPTAWNGGYVAIRNGEIVFSPDGISDWNAWPHQPFEEQFDPERDDHRALVVHEGTLLAVVSTEESLSASATTDGQTWRDIPFEASVDQSRGRAFTLHTGAPGVFVIGTNARELSDNEAILSPAWVLSGDEFILYPEPQALFAPLMLPSDVSTIWHGDDVIWPGEIIAGAEKDGRLTGFGWQRETPTADGVEALDPPLPVAYTSTDGNTWVSLDPVTAPADASLCEPKPPAVIPEIVETGPLGWFAAGSGCGVPGVIWASSDGLEWHQLDGIERLAGWDRFLPFAVPTFLIEEDRVLIYAAQDYPRESFWDVWVGEPID